LRRFQRRVSVEQRFAELSIAIDEAARPFRVALAVIFACRNGRDKRVGDLHGLSNQSVALLYENTSIANHARRRQRWLILLTRALPLTRPLGLPIYVSRIPAAPFSLGNEHADSDYHRGVIGNWP
jgi:hypothetical protein